MDIASKIPSVERDPLAGEPDDWFPGGRELEAIS